MAYSPFAWNERRKTMKILSGWLVFGERFEVGTSQI
jgi:hypothetical protein